MLLIGAGQMAELTARQLHALGVQSLLITSRTFDHAVALARKLDGTAVPFENHRPYLKIADIVIGSLSAAQPVLEPDEFEAVMRERRYRPVFLIDLGVPRNFDERLNSMENVYLYDIDDLSAVVNESIGDREREAEKAETIVAEALDSFLQWLDGLDLVPAIHDIRLSIEQLRDAELGRHRAWLATMAPAERARIESLTRTLVNKLLHRILAGLRSTGAGSPDPLYTAEIARRLLCGELVADGPAMSGAIANLDFEMDLDSDDDEES